MPLWVSRVIHKPLHSLVLPLRASRRNILVNGVRISLPWWRRPSSLYRVRQCNGSGNVLAVRPPAFQSPCYRVRQCNRPREVDKTLGITGFSSNQVSTATPFFSQIPFLRQNTLHLRKWDFIHHSPSLAKNPLFILTKALHNILANTRDIFSKWMAEQNLTPALTYLISVCCLSSSPLQAPAKRNRG